MDIPGEVAIGLLGVLGTIIAFLGFLCALYFSREWSGFTKRSLKVLVFAMGFSSLITGVCSIFSVAVSLTLNSLILGFVAISYLLISVIGCMIVAAFIVTAITLVRG